MNEKIRAVAYAALPELQGRFVEAGCVGELVVRGAMSGTIIQKRGIKYYHDRLEARDFNRIDFETMLQQRVRPKEMGILDVPATGVSWKGSGTRSRALAIMLDQFSAGMSVLKEQARDIEGAFLEAGGDPRIKIGRISHVTAVNYVGPLTERLPLTLRRTTADIFACYLAVAGISNVLFRPMVIGAEAIELH